MDYNFYQRMPYFLKRAVIIICLSTRGIVSLVIAKFRGVYRYNQTMKEERERERERERGGGREKKETEAETQRERETEREAETERQREEERGC